MFRSERTPIGNRNGTHPDEEHEPIKEKRGIGQATPISSYPKRRWIKTVAWSGYSHWEGLPGDEGKDFTEARAPARAVWSRVPGEWVSDKEGMKPVRELGVAEIIGVETLGQFDTMYLDAGVLSEGIIDFSAGRSAGLVAVE